jgi:acetyl-CoA carboxylase biotin carboxylase subunit
MGPPPEAMQSMGDKTYARQTARKLNIPIIPGLEEGTSDYSIFEEWSKKIGYPLLIKAAMGGGGKGMRIVRNENELKSSFELARKEAEGAFGDPTLYMEKYLEKPRHIEFQILADSHGNVVHLGERECSIQRRHQKIVEESPSVIVDEEMRQKMGRDACKIAREAGYINAGTVEFLVDEERNYYFLEMNTRLQVEHPVTELVTGVDIVKEQFSIASGEPLRLKQEEIHHRGAAIEVRVYAEDPDRNFFPAPGLVKNLVEPSGPGIRLDNGVYEGFEIPMTYDPLISKLIVWAENRERAINRMIRALNEYRIGGINTTIGFLKAIMEDERFRR